MSESLGRALNDPASANRATPPEVSGGWIPTGWVSATIAWGGRRTWTKVTNGGFRQETAGRGRTGRRAIRSGLTGNTLYPASSSASASIPRRVSRTTRTSARPGSRRAIRSIIAVTAAVTCHGRDSGG